MKFAAYDPFLSPERALALGVDKVELDELLARAVFITLHTPLTEATRNLIDTHALAAMKDGVRIINCARGGLVVEADLKAALDSGKVAGAAIDVFPVEPAKENMLFGNPRLIATPHLGASTNEAQENVALQIAEQMADFLMTGAVVNALNMPSLSAEDSVRLKPYLRLAEQLGSFAGQLTECRPLERARSNTAAPCGRAQRKAAHQRSILHRDPQAAARHGEHGQRAVDLQGTRNIKIEETRSTEAPRRITRTLIQASPR